MQHGLGSTLEHEENDQHSKEDIGGGVDSLEVKQGVQDMKISKHKQSHMKKRKRTVVEWAPLYGWRCDQRRAAIARRRGEPDINVCTVLVTAMGWWCTR